MLRKLFQVKWITFFYWHVKSSFVEWPQIADLMNYLFNETCAIRYEMRSIKQSWSNRSGYCQHIAMKYGFVIASTFVNDSYCLAMREIFGTFTPSRQYANLPCCLFFVNSIKNELRKYPEQMWNIGQLSFLYWKEKRARINRIHW